MNLPNFVNPLLRRAFMCLEDGAWNDANGLLEQVLNQEQGNAYAYLGKLFVKLRVRNYAELEAQTEAYDVYNEYNHCIRFADAELANYLQWLVASIKYNKASDVLNSGSKEVSDYENAAQLFHEIAGNFDADAKEKLCYEKINEIKEQEEERKKRKMKLLKKILKIGGIIIAIMLIVKMLYPYIEEWYTHAPLKDAKIGKYVYMGEIDGKKLEWIVLDIQDNKKLLLSKYFLDNDSSYVSHDYTNDQYYGGWEKSNFRKECLDIFNNCFTDEEKNKILLTRLESQHKENHKNVIEITRDYLFLFSKEEYDKYCKNNNKMHDLQYIVPEVGDFKKNLLDFYYKNGAIDEKTYKDSYKMINNTLYWTLRTGSEAFSDYINDRYCEVAIVEIKGDGRVYDDRFFPVKQLNIDFVRKFYGVSEDAYYVDVFTKRAIAVVVENSFSSHKGLRPAMWVRIE